MNIAIIPARGGSKRIPRKNIKFFGGKPMLAHAIGAASKSGLFEQIVVSTDDEEIGAVAREWGAVTPFVRPDDLADDYSATVPVVAHAIQVCQSLGWAFEHVCCIYPCVPLIDVSDLSQGLALLKGAERTDYCFPVTQFASPIQRALRRLGDGKMQSFYEQYWLTRTQDLEPAYYDAGQFYWGRPEAWLRNSQILSNANGYVIPDWRVVDIDTPDDWLRAEALYAVLNKHAHAEVSINE